MKLLRPSHATVHWLRFYSGMDEGYYQIGGEHGECNGRCYLAQLVPIEPTLEGHRDGKTFDPALDTVRLNKQMLRVYHAMRDGHWRSLDMIEEIVNRFVEGGRNYAPQASISARLRDFRKPRFGGHEIERRRTSIAGLYEYRLIWNEEVPRP